MVVLSMAMLVYSGVTITEMFGGEKGWFNPREAFAGDWSGDGTYPRV